MTRVFMHERLFALQSLLQPLAIALIIAATLVLGGGIGLALAGVVAWPDIIIGFEGADYQIGPAVVSGLFLLMVTMCVYLPGALRIQRLELAHRRFHIGMEDVTRAYHAAHAADRAGMFQMKHEFDAVRERIAYLREHPELGELEPEILEAAAQMSQVSQELAQIYSDEKMERARQFLIQRQQEIAEFNSRLDAAKQMTQELRQWADRVEVDEDVAHSQLERLRGELRETLPELGLGHGPAGGRAIFDDKDLDFASADAGRVVGLPTPKRVTN